MTRTRLVPWALTAALLVCLGASPAVAGPSPRKQVTPPRLAFIDDSTVYETSTDGAVREVTWTPAGDGKWSPTWSPDGTRVAYVSGTCGALPGPCLPSMWVTGNAIHVADVRTGDSELVLYLPHTQIRSLEWSPSGRQFTFVGAKLLETFFAWLGTWAFDVYVVNVDGSQLAPVTVDGLSDEPTWSPDGTRLAYRSARGGTSGIYVSSPLTLAAATRVSHPGLDYNADTPRWSPDGRSIAYLAHTLPVVGAVSSSAGPDIWIAKSDASTQSATGHAGWGIDWAPNSRRLAYYKEQRGRLGVHVLQLGGRSRLVAQGAYPRWAPDGRHLALNLHRQSPPHNNLVVLDLVSGTTTPVFSESSYYSLSTDYRWTR